MNRRGRYLQEASHVGLKGMKTPEIVLRFAMYPHQRLDRIVPVKRVNLPPPTCLQI